MIKIKFVNDPNLLESKLKESNKIQVIDKNSHEIKQIMLRDYKGELEMLRKLSVGDRIRTTHNRFRNITDYEAYICSIDEGYDAEVSIFNGYIYLKNTLQFNSVNTSQYGNGCDSKHEIIEYRGKNCVIPTKGYCFIKCFNSLTGDDYKQQGLALLEVKKDDQKL